jgi:positive regulator of sigma E activity
VIVSVLAGLFLLVPMIVLSFIASQKVRLGVTVAFVLVFTTALGWFSKATNDASMGAGAAYAAVLVVFVGQTSPIH